MQDMKKITIREIHGELSILALTREFYGEKETSVTWAQVMHEAGRVDGMISLAYALGIISEEEMKTLVSERIDTLLGKYTKEDFER